MKNKNNKLNPSTASPATPSPITVPPLNETFKAFGKLVLAASAVRALASVAIRIPIFPANALKNAPRIKAGTIIQCVDSTSVDTMYRATDAPTTKKDRSLYSAPKNASAPSLMALDISIIFASPAACLRTHWALKIITIRPSTASTIGR